MGQFKSPRQEQQLLATHDWSNFVFRPIRDQLSVISYRHAKGDAFDLWKEGYAVEMTAGQAELSRLSIERKQIGNAL